MKKAKTKKTMNEISAFKAPIRVNKKHITVRFPASMAKYLQLQGNELMWVPTGGTVQLLGASQELAIPLQPIDKEAFQPQTT
jgi:hypothetical protein